MSPIASVEALAFIAPNATAHSVAYAPDDEVGPLPSQPAAPGAVGKSPSFGSILSEQMQQLDSSIKLADAQSVRLASGQAENLHRVMLDIEQARISLQLAMQVRNRLMEALQEIQRWQM
jgi:flagellar hook-basal body complex protein FliE